MQRAPENSVGAYSAKVENKAKKKSLLNFNLLTKKYYVLS